VRGVRLTHSGGPTVLIEVEGWRLLTDHSARAQRGAQVAADEAGAREVA